MIRSIATLPRDVARVMPVEFDGGSVLAVDGTFITRGGVSVGTLSERAVVDLLVGRGRRRLDEVRVGEVMGEPLPEIGPRTLVVAVARMLERRPAVLVTRGLDLVGIVTRADLLRLVGA